MNYKEKYRQWLAFADPDTVGVVRTAATTWLLLL